MLDESRPVNGSPPCLCVIPFASVTDTDERLTSPTRVHDLAGVEALEPKTGAER